MTDEGHERLRRLFDRAMELPAASRRAFVEGSCRDDPALARRLLAMLAAEEERFLADPTGGVPAVADAGAERGDATLIREGPGTEIGPYKLLQQIGEGTWFCNIIKAAGLGGGSAEDNGEVMMGCLANFIQVDEVSCKLHKVKTDAFIPGTAAYVDKYGV